MKISENTVRNIALFSDPATPFSCDIQAEKALVRLIRSGESREYIIDMNTGSCIAQHKKEGFFSLASLLSSPEFADLRSFSETQRRVLSVKNIDNMIENAGVIDSFGQKELSLNVMRELFEPAESDAVKILLVDGPAGVGKTSLIERMAYERAKNPAAVPILHITSKGRRLSNLPDAIGKTASDLDARFRAEQVPVLARLNALQIAIDGFDELVQPDGYGNAWGALRDFIRQMGGGGPLILAGRDTFFDQEDVRKQFSKIGQNVNLTMVRLTEVSETSAKKWLEGQGWEESELNSRYVKDFFRNTYTRRPFFLSQVASIKSFENLPVELGSPQAILIDRLLDREADIFAPGLRNADKQAIKSALNLLCEEMAVDMADREVDSISIEFLEFVCTYALSSITDEDEMSAIARKIGSMAVLESMEGASERKFPHSEIQNHFLARALIRAVAAGELFPSMRIAIYGADQVEAFADAFRTVSAKDAYAVISRLREMLNSEKFAHRLNSNVCALLIATLVRGGGEKLDIRDVSTSDVRVFDRLSPAYFHNVTIGRLDSRGADLSEVEFYGCQIGSMIADDTTRFGASLPSVATLQIYAEAGVRFIHDSAQIQEWLERHSLSASQGDRWSEVSGLPLVKLFERICRRFMRQHYIKDNETDDGYALIHDSMWGVIRDILESEGRLLVDSNRATQGTKADFYRVIAPELLLAPQGDESSVNVRKKIARKAIELAE